MIRYRTGSRRLILPDAISILARNTRSPFWNSPAWHAPEEVQVLVRGDRDTVSSDPVRSRFPDIRGSHRRSNRPHRPCPVRSAVNGVAVEGFEIVGCIPLCIAIPSETQPAHVVLNGVDILLLFLGWVRIVEAQVAASAEFSRHAKVQTDRLRMADMQIAVRFRRKPCHQAFHPLFG